MNDDFDLTQFFVDVFIGMLIGGLVGALIGRSRGRLVDGLGWGIILGPIGWLIVALLKDLRQKCPHCRGTIVVGARKCMHCGEDLVGASRSVPVAAPVTQVRPLPSSTPESTILCPIWDQRIRVSTLKPGENFCPHCYEKFIAE